MSQSTQAEISAALEQVEKKMGFVPNLFREMSACPPALEAYQSALKAMSKSPLRPRDQQIVMLTAVTKTDCHYCQAAHGMGLKAMHVEQAVIETIKAGGVPEDPELAALVEATRMIMEKNGYLTEAEQSGLAARGLDRERLIAICMLIAMKSFTNNVAHLSGAPIDAQFGG